MLGLPSFGMTLTKILNLFLHVVALLNYPDPWSPFLLHTLLETTCPNNGEFLSSENVALKMFAFCGCFEMCIF